MRLLNTHFEVVETLEVVCRLAAVHEHGKRNVRGARTCSERKHGSCWAWWLMMTDRVKMWFVFGHMIAPW